MKNTEIVRITAYSHEGKGIARLDKLVLFIEGALKGELVEVEITEKKKNYALAKIVEIIEESPERVAADTEQTGGCNLAHASYKHQLEIKEEIIDNALRKLPGIDQVLREDILPADLAEKYRNKGRFRMNFAMDGSLSFGFYEEGSHVFRNSKESILYSDQVNQLLKDLAEIIGQEEKRQAGLFGNLENLMIRESGKSGQMMLVFYGKELAGSHLKERLKEIVISNFPQVSALYLNEYNLLEGAKGKQSDSGFLEDSIGHLNFRIWPETFFQVHKSQTLKLYEKVADYLEIESGAAQANLIIDAYGGIGTIGSFIAQGARKVISIDQYEGAKKEGQLAARLNGIDNIEFIVGKVEEILPELAEKKHMESAPDVIILDPPRAGCKREVLEAASKMKVPTILYVSCNPGSLGRDLKILTEEGYKIEKVVGVDMFPQTRHVECVTLMSRIDK